MTQQVPAKGVAGRGGAAAGASEADAVARAARVAYYAFVGALIYQSAHMFEHVVQLHQWVTPGGPEPLGLFGAWFDFVWVHFVFNVGLMAALVAAFAAARRPGAWRESVAGKWWWGWLLAVQGYHTVEHVAQMWQYYRIGLAHPHGIAGQYVPNVILHYDFNAAVLILMAGVFLTYRPKPRPEADAAAGR